MHLSWIKWAEKRIDRGLPPDDSLVQSSIAKTSQGGDARDAVVRQELELLYALVLRSALSQIEEKALRSFEDNKQIAAETGINRRHLYRFFDRGADPKYSKVIRFQFQMRFSTPQYSRVVGECVPEMLRSYQNRLDAGEPLDRTPSRSEIIVASLVTTRPYDEFCESFLQTNATSQAPSSWRKMFELWQSVIHQPQRVPWEHFREASRQWCEPWAILMTVAEDIWRNIGEDVEEMTIESKGA